MGPGLPCSEAGAAAAAAGAVKAGRRSADCPWTPTKVGDGGSGGDDEVGGAAGPGRHRGGVL